MKITIHKIEKYVDRWKVTFTSERNEMGMTIYTPTFSSVEKLVKHLEDYIIKNFPEEVITEPQEFDSDEITVEEQPNEEQQPEEPTEEELQLQEMQKELGELLQQKDSLANEIKNLLEDWKLDLDLIKFKEDFNITDEQYEQIIQDKLNRKLPKYVELKTQYEQLKQQIANKEEEIRQFAEENNLDAMI